MAKITIDAENPGLPRITMKRLIACAKSEGLSIPKLILTLISEGLLDRGF